MLTSRAGHIAWEKLSTSLNILGTTPPAQIFLKSSTIKNIMTKNGINHLYANLHKFILMDKVLVQGRKDILHFILNI